MKDIDQIYKTFGISSGVLSYGKRVEEELKDRFADLDETAEYNQMKVIAAMQKNKVSAECFQGSTGY